MRTNKFIPLFIALLIHLIPLSYFTFKKNDSQSVSTSVPHPQGIDLNTFSVARKSFGGSGVSRSKPIDSVGLPKNSKAEQSTTGTTASGGSAGLSGAATSSAGPTFIKMREPQYPPIARKNGLEGKVKAKVFYNAEGLITKVDIVESSGVKMLDEAVLKAVSEWKLSQGTAGSFEKSFEFKLNN